MNTGRFSFQAAILDMDGVITKTAILHAKAWKQMFDAVLRKMSGEDFKPLDIRGDYYRYIDGIPRHDGIRNFLRSRNIQVPSGTPGDSPEADTIFGLGARKNEIFLSILQKEGVQVYEDTVNVANKWKKAGIKLAVISSSRNCERIIEAAGLTDLFDTRVDGTTLEAENLRGKPEPDMLLRACELLSVNNSVTIVIEDAIAGIEAGVKGKLGLVVGVSRGKDEKQLKEAGADIVVKNLTDLVTVSGRLKVPRNENNNHL